jgi:hypothetical protein
LKDEPTLGRPPINVLVWPRETAPEDEIISMAKGAEGGILKSFG